jgi:hypothetical protein
MDEHGSGSVCGCYSAHQLDKRAYDGRQPVPLTEFERLAALSVSTLRLRLDSLPRSSAILVSAARTGLSRLDSDLHLAVVDERLSEPLSDLCLRWAQAHLECGAVPLATTCSTWRADWGIVLEPGRTEGSSLD